MADQWLEKMVEEIRANERELNESKKSANRFYRMKGLDLPFPNIQEPESGGTLTFKPDEFYSKGFAPAARMFLERRKQATTADEILKALEAGGFDFDEIGWKQDTRARTVAMSLAKNNAMFHRLPNGMFGLLSWYAEAIEKKKGKKDEKDEAASE